jgi:hypothetical protein
MQSLDPDDLPAVRSVSLRRLLGDFPVRSHGSKKHRIATSAVYAHAWAVHDAVRRDYRMPGDEGSVSEQATEQAAMEIRRTIRTCAERPHDPLCVAGMRAVLLLGLWSLPSVRSHFSQSSEKDASLADDLFRRVLPLCMPPFIQCGGARPLEFVTDVLLMAKSWQGETFFKGISKKRRKRGRDRASRTDRES